jgi:hypothetical protein
MNRTKLLLVFLLLMFVPLSMRSQAKKEYGVYEYVVREAQGSIEQISSDITTAASKGGWTVVAGIDAGTPEGCTFKAHVIAIYQPSYAKSMIAANRKTGPFAAIDRINIFSDEQGTHVSIVNPHSIIRTVLMDDAKYNDIAEQHLQALRQLILSSVKGTTSDKQSGEMRSEGFIGKTMGVVAGGRFDEKVENVYASPKGNLDEIAGKVEKALKDGGKRWGTHVVYRVSMKEEETEIIGVTGWQLEGKSFDIVGAGSDDSRGDDKCPGLAHAGAYPLELVVTHENGAVVVRMVDAMFRMKMYFEDAGKWAFMKNMSMPGSIKDEITDRLSLLSK